MTTGIVAAMRQEVNCLLGETDRYHGQIVPGMPARLSDGILLIISGIGAVRARRAAGALVKAGATSLVSWGTAGALVPDLSAGSLVIPQRILSQDHAAFFADSAWHKRLCARVSGHVDLHTRPLIQSNKVLRNPYERENFSKKYGGIAVDMESAAVAGAALSANIPFIAIRAVSDSINMNIPAGALTAVDDMGNVRPLRVLKSMVRSPRETPQLIQLGRGIHAAIKALKTVLSLSGYELLAP